MDLKETKKILYQEVDRFILQVLDKYPFDEIGKLDEHEILCLFGKGYEDRVINRRIDCLKKSKRKSNEQDRMDG